MAFAAAAIRARQGVESGSDNEFLDIPRAYRKPVDTAFLASTCTGLVLFFSGLGWLLSLLTNTRAERVEEYDADVHRWQSMDRPRLLDSDIRVFALWPATSSRQATRVEAQLIQSSEDDWSFDDSEGGDRVDAYQPLKHVLQLEIPCYYANCSMLEENAANPLGHMTQASDWLPQILPAWEHAPRVSFEFIASHSGQQSHFTTPPVPLAYDLRTAAQAPQPRQFCMGPSHGVYLQPGGCHHAERLTDLCVAIEFGDDGWQLRHALDTRRWNSSRRTGTFGCNPQAGYEATTYTKDPCWGPYPRTCNSTAHQLQLTIRGWSDPYIKALEVTNGTFDFGFKPVTELAVGSILMLIGVIVFGVPMAIRCRSRRKSKGPWRPTSPCARTLGRP
ncbi:unnamed protein product [Effrenium voratum]|nr:unnamed protein product [Effrenium voratum]